MGEITQLLEESRAGRAESQSALFQLVYGELTRLAQARLARAAPMTELDAPGLVHEAYLRLVDQTELPGRDRAAFFSYAAGVMRSVIVDRLRERSARKRGGGQVRVTLATDYPSPVVDEAQFDGIDSALSELRKIDERCAKIVELRYFAGLSIEEIAALLDLSIATVKRDWQKARAFLFRAIQESS